MSKYAVINLKTDPQLKKLAAKTADKLGISVSAVLNNELKRFAAEQSVTFDVPKVPNPQTARQMAISKKEIEAGDYSGPFDTAEDMVASLRENLKSK